MPSLWLRFLKATYQGLTQGIFWFMSWVILWETGWLPWDEPFWTHIGSYELWRCMGDLCWTEGT